MGRPTSYDEDVAAVICDRLAMDESLSSICREEGFPSTTTVYRWRDSNPEFRANYARARVDQGHTVADQMGEIRAKLLAGTIDAATATAAANMIKWESGKRAPKDFGDMHRHEVTGADGGPMRHAFAALSEEEIDARIGALTAGDEQTA